MRSLCQTQNEEERIQIELLDILLKHEIDINFIKDILFAYEEGMCINESLDYALKKQ